MPRAPSDNLFYHGGVGHIGIQTDPQVYLVTWGWTSDPKGVLPYLESFMNGVGGSPWNNSVTQYCQNVKTSTKVCKNVAAAIYAGNPSGVLKGTWADPSTPPAHPTQSQLAQEAVDAAAHFGNTTPGSNVNTQYVIMTATGKSSSGFGSSYCAYHDYKSTSDKGNIAYTNLPYIPDAGGNCGANFINAGTAGQLDGVSIVEGHEFSETETDNFPTGGWLDSFGAENADKCIWISSGEGATRNVTFSTGTYAVQTVWSNAMHTGNGGCAISYP